MSAPKVIDLMAALREALEHDRVANPQNYCPDCTHSLNTHGAFGCTMTSCPCKARPTPTAPRGAGETNEHE